MYRRKVYADYCPAGGRVQPSRCARCNHINGEATISGMTFKENRYIICMKQSRVEKLTDQGMTKAAAEAAVLRSFEGGS